MKKLKDIIIFNIYIYINNLIKYNSVIIRRRRFELIPLTLASSTLRVIYKSRIRVVKTSLTLTLK